MRKDRAERRRQRLLKYLARLPKGVRARVSRRINLSKARAAIRRKKSAFYASVSRFKRSYKE